MFHQQRTSMSAYPPTYPSSYAPHQQQQPQHQRPYVLAQPPSWAQPPPFAGAPPIPPGVSVNPQQWQAGVWQFNPAYKHSRNPAQPQQQQQQQQHVPWIPSHHWLPSQARQPPQAQQPPSSAQSSQSSQQASYNPFKRQPKAPSAEYLATKLSDNPLGLSNLTPATVEEYYRQGHETPWIWKPRELGDESADATPSKQRNATDPSSNGSSPSQSRRHSEGNVDQETESFTSKIELQPTFSSKIVRTPDHYRTDSSHTPSPTSRRGSRSSIDSQLSSRMAGLNTGSSSSSQPLTRHSTMPVSSSSSFSSFYSSSPTKHEFPAAPMLTDHLSDEPDSMLSPLILTKTPMVASSNLRSVRNNHPNPLLATQSLDTIVEAPSGPNSLASSTTATHALQHHQQQGGNGAYYVPPFQHANTMPNIPKTQLSYPQTSAFPPLMHIPKTHDRESERDRDRERERERDHRERADRERESDRLGSRFTSYVDPHVSSAATTPSPRSRDPSRPSSRPSSRQSSAHASPVHASNTTPPTYPATYPISSPPGPGNPYSQPSGGLISPTNGYSAGPSPTSATFPSKVANPLPAPPQMSARIPIPPGDLANKDPAPTHSHSDTKSTKSARLPLVLPVQRTPPVQYRERRRYGYWNQRGDHLTQNGYIVYAPPDRTYPDDLKTYPPVQEGYQDHDRKFATYCVRPELPQSLPRHGQPPEIPYDSFVVWEYTI